MPCSKSRWFRLFLSIFCAVWWASASAEPIALSEVAFTQGDDGYELSLKAEFDLAQHLEQMLDRGVTLSFRVEFELSRSRWYWFDERVARKTINLRLSYQELTRQYRVASGDFQQSFATLRQALKHLSTVRRWHIAEPRALSPGGVYDARLRFYLDTAQLPKPLQLSAFANSEWHLASDTLSWRVQINDGAGK